MKPIDVKLSHERIGYADIHELFQECLRRDQPLHRFLPDGLIPRGAVVITYKQAHDATKNGKELITKLGPVFVILERGEEKVLDLIGGRMREWYVILGKQMFMNNYNDGFRVAYHIPD